MANANKEIEGVLIAGGGAVGLTAALSLARRGVPVTVLEAEPDLVTDFRGSTFHPPTLEMLDDLGLAEPLIAQAVVVRSVQFRDREEGLIAEFDQSPLAPYTRYPFRLQIDQSNLSRMLFKRLQDTPGVEVIFGHRVTDVEVDNGQAAVVTKTLDGVHRFRARYLVGADGGASTVRRALEIGFQGITYPERYLTLFTPFDFSRHLPNFASVTYMADRREWVIMLRSPDLWRVLFPILPGESDAHALTDESIQSRLQGVVATGEPYSIVHRRVYKVHQRVAATYRKGPVMLAGDAAHVNSPMGGMGLNGGIHDAVNLSEKLGRLWSGEADDQVLDAYASERRRIALDFVQAQTHSNALSLGASDPTDRKLFRDDMRKTAADPDLTLRYLLRTSMIASLRDPLGAD